MGVCVSGPSQATQLKPESAAVSPLFQPLSVGAIGTTNRIFMAPMTRSRNKPNGVPDASLLGKYYAQRASTGLIVTEATAISRQGLGWLGAPGIWNHEQEAEWAKITSEVHKAGGKIVLQTWHMGRVVHPDFIDGEVPVAPSAIAAIGEAHTAEGKKPYVQPRALSEEEIKGLVQDHVQAVKRARAAGFDGIEVGAANGYLLDQFIRDGSNKRTDRYGGSIDNRLRLILEVVDACVAAWSADRIGIRLSPTNPTQDMKDSDPVATFTRAAQLLAPRKLAYLHVTEPIGGMGHVKDVPVVAPHIRKAWPGVLILNGGYDKATAEAALNEKRADAIAFGVPILANPDLVERYRQGTTQFNQPDFATLFTGGEKGYLDYPTLEDKFRTSSTSAAVAS